ncbi:hypothetical protein A2U01_0108851, partial [Trifolium medium]|nr:hypothetical protein [Trifolium medium]
SLGERKRKKATYTLRFPRCSDGKPIFPRCSERKRRALQETEISWLQREKAPSALLARWHARWASKP